MSKSCCIHCGNLLLAEHEANEETDDFYRPESVWLFCWVCYGCEWYHTDEIED